MKDIMETRELQVFASFGLMILKEKRTVYINDVVTEKMAALFNLALLEMEMDSPDEDITVYISSPGGDVTAGLSMIDTMNTISCDVRTICTGQASSMAAVILMCGTKGKRFILPHSYVLIHQILAFLGGEMKQATDIEIFASDISRRKAQLTELVAEKTGQDKEKVMRDLERDYTLNAGEALEYGIVDSIVSKHGREE